jgi:hypothetical protein
VAVRPATVDTNVGGLNPKPAVISVPPGAHMQALVSFSMMGGVSAKIL